MTNESTVAFWSTKVLEVGWCVASILMNQICSSIGGVGETVEPSKVWRAWVDYWGNTITSLFPWDS